MPDDEFMRLLALLTELEVVAEEYPPAQPFVELVREKTIRVIREETD